MTLFEHKNACLASEVEFFFSAFFTGTPDRHLLDRYIAANEICFPISSPESAASIGKIVNLRLDVEAVEFVMRLRQRDNVLTKKVQILFFLVEVRSEYFGYFYCIRKARARAIAELLFSIALTAFKYIKGRYLIRKYDLI